MTTNFKSMREATGQALCDLAKTNPKIVALSADVKDSVKLKTFSELFPERYFEIGVAEQNLMGVAAGLALEGFIPFVDAYAVFNPGRNWDQLRVSVCYQNANVKVIGAHSGINVGPDGATHQALEDIAITRCLPKLAVISPADPQETYEAIKAIVDYKGPVYLRIPRIDSPNFTNCQKFEIGKITELKPGKDLTIIGTGYILQRVLEVANELQQENINIRVLNCSTIKPLDQETLLKACKETKAILTIEDHQIHGGMGSTIAEFVSQNCPTKMKLMGINDTFGESGEAPELLEKYGLGKDNIRKEILKLI